MNPYPSESLEARVARYLDWGEEAVKSASHARGQELREAHLQIASSWLKLAEEALKKLRSEVD